MRHNFKIPNQKPRGLFRKLRDAAYGAKDAFIYGRAPDIQINQCRMSGGNLDETPFVTFDEYGVVTDIRFIGMQMTGHNITPGADVTGIDENGHYFKRKADTIYGHNTAWDVPGLKKQP